MKPDHSDSQPTDTKEKVSHLLNQKAEGLNWEDVAKLAERLRHEHDWKQLLALSQRSLSKDKMPAGSVRLFLKALKGSEDQVSWDSVANLAEQLRRDNNWTLLLELLRLLLSRGELPLRPTELFLMALRATDDQTSALKYLADKQHILDDIGVAIQWASILCELGDFAPLLAVSEAGREGNTNQTIDFLILLAWAHENAQGIDHARAASSLYERALAELKKEANSPPELDDSPHPEAGIKLPGVERNLNALRTLWSQRGYAEVSAMLPDLQAKSSQLWLETINDSKKLAHASRLDPYIQRIVAWCHFRLKDYETSLAAYGETLELGALKHRPQFEQALVLFSVGRVNEAEDQYEKAICDLQDVSAIRRCGLLRVAFSQFARSVIHDPKLGDTVHARCILEYFRVAMAKVLKHIEKDLPEHAGRIGADVESLVEILDKILRPDRENDRVTREIIDWNEAKVVGFKDPGASLCGLFFPIIEYRGERFTCVSNDPSSDTPQTVQLKSSPERIKRVSLVLPSPTSRIMYFSGAANKVLNIWPLTLPAIIPASLRGHSESKTELVVCVDGSYAPAVMDQIARDLIQKASSVFIENTAEPEKHAAEKSALLAFYAAQRAVTLYQAALLYVSLSKQPIALRGARDDSLSVALPAEDRLSQLASIFSERERTLPTRRVLNLEPAALVQLADLVIKRATEVRSIKDKQRSALEAMWAAAEMQLVLANSPEIISAQRKLAEILPKTTKRYLSDKLETIALALEPAFYRSVELLRLSKPVLDLFSFYKGSTTGGHFVNEIGTISETH